MHLYDYKLQELNGAPPAPELLPNIRSMGFNYLWPEITGSGVVVAVIDSGCDINHPDLKGNIIGVHNFVPGRPAEDVTDDNGHGTHVAGTIAANGRIKGGAYGAKLLILKVFGADGSCDMGRIIDAIKYAIAWIGPNGERVSVISMSLGGPEYSVALEEVVNLAADRDILVVCAAGNSGDGKKETVEIDYPAGCKKALAVGAVDLKLNACYFTDTNNLVDVAAPGADIISTYPGGRYVMMSGTSMAAPGVSGFAACMIEKFVRRNQVKPTADQLTALIRCMTVDAADVGIDVATGAGFVTALPSAALFKAG